MADGLETVVVFESAEDGYGDAQRGGRAHSYHRCFGAVDPRWQGELAPGWAVAASMNVSCYDPPVAAVQWEDSSGDPLLLAPARTSSTAGVIFTVRGGGSVLTEPLAAAPTGAALHDDGSGVPYLYIAEGAPSGGVNKVQRRNRAGTLTTCTNLRADKLLSLNNDLYITATPSGGTAACGVGKVAAGVDPASAAQPALTTVGFAGTPVNNIVGHGSGRFPVALKPEGIFVYDRALDIWMPVGRVAYHPDNGKVYWYEEDDLCVALGAGGAVRMRDLVLVPYDPLPLGATPDASTTTQAVAAAGSSRHWGLLVTRPGAKSQMTGGVGAGVAQVDFGITSNGGASYIDSSGVVSDNDPTSAANLSALPAAGGWVVVGHQQPFVGVYLDVLAPNTNAATLIVEIWNGAWAYQASWDLTDSGDGRSLARSGWAFPGTVAQDLVGLGWQPSTLTVGSPKTRYWMRLRWTGTLSANVRVKQVRLLPWRPSIDPANFVSDGYDRAGVMAHILVSRTDESGRHVTHDMGVPVVGLGAVDEFGAVLVADVAAGVTNHGRGLWLFGKKTFLSMAIEPDDRPPQVAWPLRSALGLCELTAVTLPETVEVVEVEVDGVDWNQTGYLYARCDDGKPWDLVGTFDTLPVTLRPSGRRVGRTWRFAVGWNMTLAQTRANRRGRVRRVVMRVAPRPRQSAYAPPATPPLV